MRVYETPGVYYERIDATGPSISPIRTDITGFVGIAERGPLHQAVPIESWRQFQAYFGGFIGSGYLAYAARAYFENGGRRCWIVRVASEAAAVANQVIMSGTNAAFVPRWDIEAYSPGVWGNDLEIEFQETHRAQTLTIPATSRGEYSTIASLAGFTRGTHVRLTQQGTVPPPQYKVVSDVDPVNSRLLWVHPNPEGRLPYDSPVLGFNPDLPILIESVEYTLVVRELGRVRRIYEGLSIIPEHARYGPRILGQHNLKQSQGAATVLPMAPEPVTIREYITDAKGQPAPPGPAMIPTPLLCDGHGSIPLQGGADGLAGLRVIDFVGEEVSPLDSDEITRSKSRGLRALQDVNELAILAVPDIHIQPISVPRLAPLLPCIPDPCLPMEDAPIAVPRVPAIGDLPPVFHDADVFQVQSALIQQCESLRDRIALLDPPRSVSRNDMLGVGALRAWRKRFESKYAAIYYPWLRVMDPLRTNRELTREIPPSGHVAGQYANTDIQIGVHKAPANAPLIWVQDVTVPINDTVHGVLNSAGVNVMRSFPSRGLRIYGARTISSETDWQYVNVRRLMMMIQKAIAYAIQWAVFEPNETVTRAKLRLALTSFLLELWQRGTLVGGAPNEAFMVKCDDENNPASERGNGRLVVEVGVAPSKPFEFVVIRVGRVNNEFEIHEEATAFSWRGGA